MKRQWGWATAALQKQGITITWNNGLRIDMHAEENLPSQDYTDGPPALGLLFVVALAWLWTCYVRDYSYYRFINEVNGGIHEIGHMLFSIVWSHMLHVLWGTILQLLFPIVFFVFFWRRTQQFIACLCGVRFATNLFNIAVYMHDATRLQLPLMSMSWDIETTMHDRNYLFDVWWVLVYTDQIALVVKWVWYVIYVLALIGMSALLIKKRKYKAMVEDQEISG